MNEKRLTLPVSDKQLRDLLLQQLQKKPLLRRKELIERCIARIELSSAQRHDQALGSTLTTLKSHLGTQLSSLLYSGLMEEDAVGQLSIRKDSPSLYAWDSAVDFVLNYLDPYPPVPKQKIFQAADQAFGTSLTPEKEDDNNLHSLMGKVLVRLEQEHRICRSPKGFTLPSREGLPNTELGFYLEQSRIGEDLCHYFRKAVHVKGGEWFESYAVQLMSLYYTQSGKTVAQANVTGGSNDGGIDGIIITTDPLGFRETILMQMKNKNAPIPSKEVREFYGAVCAEKGTRGLFVTTAGFHSMAVKLLDKVDNLVGIDGEKLFEIACACRYGIVEEKGRLVLDSKVFMDQN